MNIKYLKLVTGEELVTQWIENSKYDTEVKLKKPLGILMSQTEKGFNIQLVPYGSMANMRKLWSTIKTLFLQQNQKQNFVINTNQSLDR